MRRTFIVCGRLYLMLAIAAVFYPTIADKFDVESSYILGYILLTMSYIVGIPLFISIVYYLILSIKFILK
jgi:hypothetical protein